MQALKSNVLNLGFKVTLLASTVAMLVSFIWTPFLYAQNRYSLDPTQTSVMSSDRVLKEKEQPSFKVNGSINIARSTSLIDFQDGTRSDSLDIRLVLQGLLLNGHSLSTTLDYSENLQDPEDTNSGLFDPIVTYGFKNSQWAWSHPYILSMTPSLTAVIPATERSIKRDQLQGAIAGALTFLVRPDGLTNNFGSWSILMGLTAGRNFHTFEEDINGQVLNQYSSNQSFGLGYNFGSWDLSLNYLHRSRWTYQGNTRDSFELSQEIAYALNENFAVNVGHSNGGSSLKANGYESNLELINENNSIVYLGIQAGL